MNSEMAYYRCCLPPSHDRHVMELYGNRFVQTAGRLFLFPIVGNNAIEPERSVSLFEERSQKHRKKDQSLIMYLHEEL